MFEEQFKLGWAYSLKNSSKWLIHLNSRSLLARLAASDRNLRPTQRLLRLAACVTGLHGCSQ